MPAQVQGWVHVGLQTPASVVNTMHLRACSGLLTQRWLACSAGLEAKYKKLYRRAIEVESDLVYVSVANAALASVPYLIALDHATRLATKLATRVCPQMGLLGMQ